MGTKNNPGNFDCYENAEPNEPMFILLARDPFAPALVNLWANLRENDLPGAIAHFAQLSRLAGLKETEPSKIQEAYSCAFNMRQYKQKTSSKL